MRIEVIFDGDDPNPILRHPFPGVVAGFLVVLRVIPEAISLLDARRARVDVIALADAIEDCEGGQRAALLARVLADGEGLLQRAKRRRAQSKCSCERCLEARREFAADAVAKQPQNEPTVQPLSVEPIQAPKPKQDVFKTRNEDISPMRQYVRQPDREGAMGFVIDLEDRTPIIIDGEPVRAPLLALAPLGRPVNAKAPRN